MGGMGADGHTQGLRLRPGGPRPRKSLRGGHIGSQDTPSSLPPSMVAPLKGTMDGDSKHRQASGDRGTARGRQHKGPHPSSPGGKITELNPSPIRHSSTTAPLGPLAPSAVVGCPLGGGGGTLVVVGAPDEAEDGVGEDDAAEGREDPTQGPAHEAPHRQQPQQPHRPVRRQGPNPPFPTQGPGEGEYKDGGGARLQCCLSQKTDCAETIDWVYLL